MNQSGVIPLHRDVMRHQPIHRIGAPPTRRYCDDEDVELLWRTISRPARIGFRVVLIFFVGSFTWASLAPLVGGAVAPGQISPDGHARRVQHLEGGIVEQLLVRDGDVVKKGQPLIRLSSAKVAADHAQLSHRRRVLTASLARLRAEQIDAAAVTFPVDLVEDPSPETAALIEGQAGLFASRRDHHETRRRVLHQKIEQLREEIAGHNEQSRSVDAQLGYLTEELIGKQRLLEQGLMAKPVVLQLQRHEAELVGRRAALTASIAGALQGIGEAELQLAAFQAERREQIAAKMDEIRGELAEIEKKLSASEDVMARLVVAAPVSGVVLNMSHNTVGGVVKPGEPLLNIVPSDEKLVIDARVAPVDIDVVRAGLDAKINLSAFSAYEVPQISGTVQSVSADRLGDDAQNQPYFLAKVEVNSNELKRLAPSAELIAGMPAEVLIVTGKRTMLEYLMEPLLASLRRSLREV